MREIEQENEWEVPEIVLPRTWERAREFLWREGRRWSGIALWTATGIAWIGLALLAVLRTPELSREVEPGRPREREYEWKKRDYFGNGAL